VLLLDTGLVVATTIPQTRYRIDINYYSKDYITKEYISDKNRTTKPETPEKNMSIVSALAPTALK